MPKRSPHGRPPKSKNRPRRTPPPARSSANGTAAPVLEQDALVGTVVASTVSTNAARPRAAPSVTAARRSAGAVRKTPGAAFNYHYLRRDIQALVVLAPSMIVLLVLAFLFLH